MVESISPVIARLKLNDSHFCQYGDTAAVQVYDTGTFTSRPRRDVGGDSVLVLWNKLNRM